MCKYIFRGGYLIDPPVLAFGGVSVTSNYNGEDIVVLELQMELLKLLCQEELRMVEIIHTLDNVSFGSGPSLIQ